MRAAVLGAGPAGFYAAQALLRHYPGIRVDILEKLPVPFGLIRYGVAPDHPATKNVITSFTEFMRGNRDRVRFFGNVNVHPGPLPPHGAHAGQITRAELDRLYNVVVAATGAKRPRGLPGVALPAHGVHPAQDFVFWINGHPDAHGRPEISSRDDRFSMQSLLRRAEHVAIVGLGNVAIDIARLLLRPVDDLQNTDISPHALEALCESRVSSVSIIGRRGPREGSWTTAALREVLTKIPGIVTHCDQKLVQADAQSANVPRATGRTLKLLAAETIDSGPRRQKLDITDASEAITEGSLSKNLHLRFLQSPQSFAFHRDEDYTDQVEVALGLNSRHELTGALHSTGESTALRCGLALLSLGYEGDTGAGLRVGWANNHGKGIIGDNRWDAETVVGGMRESSRSFAPTAPGIDTWIREHNAEVVSWDGWERIDDEERHRAIVMTGGEGGRERVKLESVTEMLHIARGVSAL